MKASGALAPVLRSDKIIEGDTTVAPEHRVRLHGIDAPNWTRRSGEGEQLVCGTTSLVALETLMAGVKVRCQVVERDRHAG